MKVNVNELNENDFANIQVPEKYLRIRRAVELVFVLVLFPFAAVICLVACILIALDSEGSPIFIQYRMGFRGNKFKIYKLRTMRKHTYHNGVYRHESHCVTRVGHWLRKFRIDELPQLLNIIKGDMSLIGPRPEPIEYFEICQDAIPLYKYRFLIKPGVTGWAQIHYVHTDDVAGARERLSYDAYYLKHINISNDLEILFKTPSVMITGRGAR
ncbi:MAG: sugar transferase [Chloroflexota bacterium]